MREAFYYDPTSPSFIRWRVDVRSGRGKGYVRKKAGDVAGGLDARGRYVTRLNYAPLLASRVVWELHNGKPPEGMVVDHIDGNIVNNAIGNLRLVTQGVNTRNKRLRAGNNTGVPGVMLQGKKYYAEYTVNGVRHRSSFGGEGAFEAAVAFRMQEKDAMLADGYTGRHINGGS